MARDGAEGHGPILVTRVAADRDPLLHEIVRRILAVGEPERIVLFGSRARGEERAESDYDLLLIERSTEPRYRRAAPYRRALADLASAKDIVVWTPAEADEWRAVPGAFITQALREGIVIYER